PRLFRLCIATRGLSLLSDVRIGIAQTRVDLLQFVPALNLNAEMIKARSFATRGDREVDSRIIEHPLGVVRLHYCGLRCEQRGVEADSDLEVLNPNVNMHPFHGVYPS